MSRISLFLLLLVTAGTALAGPAVAELEGVWLRAMPPGQPNTAAYLSLRNVSNRPLLLVGGSCPLAGRVEVHTTREIDGYMRMERLEQVAIAPGEQLVLQPGGMHLMLLGVDEPLVPGTRVELCLDFAGGEQLCDSAEIRRSEPGSAAHHHGHH